MKAQVAVEFLYVMAFIMIIGGVLIAVVGNEIGDKKDQELLREVRDEARKARQEVFIAADVEDGYQREFEVPQRVNNQEYNLTISDNTLSAFSGVIGVVYSAPTVQGQFQKGTNTIRREGGVIHLNS